MRISVTQIESFRLWSDPEQEWMSEAELVASIRGEFRPTPRVELGTAFGAVLEDPDRYLTPDGFRYGAYVFSRDVMEPALAVFDRRGIFEVKATKAYGACTVVAKADQLLGAQLIENKTTLSTFDFDKYAASCQWRFMADIFQPAWITYHVFCLSERARDGSIELRGIETFNLYPYAELHRDCCDLLRRFVDYVTARGLDGFLRERQRAADAA